jgi:isopentenyl-diphosphate delta-isomerase
MGAQGEPELVVLLDADGRPMGEMPKNEVHTDRTPLHWAFSVYVFDPAGRLLVTRRALSKLTWPGVWSNSCCGHVQPGEKPEHAARRRLLEELSLDCPELGLALPDFRYRATSPEGVMENEVCPVFTTVTHDEPTPDPDEVAEWRWVSWSSFQDVARQAPWLISPWAASQARQLPPIVVA